MNAVTGVTGEMLLIRFQWSPMGMACATHEST